MHVPAAAPLAPPMTAASLAGPLVRYGFAAVIGAAISALLERRLRRIAAELANGGPLIRPSDTSDPLSNPSANGDPLSRPYDCQLCKLRWRCPSDQEAHLASKEHRRNVALLKASQPHGGALSKEDENMHCAFCNVWLRDAAAYSIHVAGKRHARNVAAAAGTLSFDFFGRMHCGPPSSTAGDLEGDELDAHLGASGRLRRHHVRPGEARECRQHLPSPIQLFVRGRVFSARAQRGDGGRGGEDEPAVSLHGDEASGEE